MSINLNPILVKSYYKLVAYDKIRFLVVGSVGFAVNYAMLALFYDSLGAPILLAQVIGAETALLATFVGNNFWAFIDHNHTTMKSKILKFHISASAGIIINSTCVVILVRFVNLYYGLALVIGSIAGLVWNYTLYKKFVFKKNDTKNIRTEVSSSTHN